jgi:GDPmannose 4,6-dehydratase
MEIENGLACIVGMGQDSYYLTKFLESKGYKVLGVARRSSQPRNYLNEFTKESWFGLIEGDVTDANSMNSIILKHKPEMVFNLSAQSHVATSFQSPSSTFEINTIGCLNILEAVRLHSPFTRVYQASTSEMFGSNYSMMKYNGNIEHFNIKETKPSDLDMSEYIKGPFQDETTPFSAQSPYAVAKIAAHQLVKLYRESYGLFVCSGILMNHESPHRGENFVTRKITRYIGRLKSHLEFNDNLHYPKLQLGNLNSKRDFSHSQDVVRAMVYMLCNNQPKDYVVGSGKTYSIQEFLNKAFDYAFKGELKAEDCVQINKDLIRPAEVDLLCANSSLAKKELGWEPIINIDGLIKCMVDHDIQLARKEYIFNN